MRNQDSSSLCSDVSAVIDLPMRLVVTLIIGTVALSAIIAFVAQPCLLPQSLFVSMDPLVSSVNTSDRNVSIQFTVTDDHHNPVKDALVTIKGNYVIKANRTDNNGWTILVFEVSISEGISEVFLDVVVKASCSTTRSFTNAIKIIKEID